MDFFENTVNPQRTHGMIVVEDDDLTIGDIEEDTGLTQQPRVCNITQGNQDSGGIDKDDLDSIPCAPVLD